jgi:hypothetical protein
MAEALSAVAAQGASGFVGYQAAVQLLQRRSQSLTQ